MTVWQFAASFAAAATVLLIYCARRWYPMQMNTRNITAVGLFVAVGTVAASFTWIPVGPAKAYPGQHAVNVLAAVLLGPVPATLVALLVGMLRMLMGIGTILALPGGMFGAFVAGVAYRLSDRYEWAVAGEVLGTGIPGALAAVAVVRLVLGQEVLAFALVGPFLLSSAVGASLAYLMLRSLEGLEEWLG